MSTEENKALVRRAYEAGNQKNWAAFDALFAPDFFVLHNASSTIQGLEAYKQLLLSGGSALPDGRFILEDMFAEGDCVVVRQTFRGTHQGDWMGMPPTGKQITMSGIAISRVANGKIVEQWANADALGLLQQLGVAPMPGQIGTVKEECVYRHTFRTRSEARQTIFEYVECFYVRSVQPKLNYQDEGMAGKDMNLDNS